MEIAKCSICSQEVSEVGQTYYEAWEKKKGDFGLGKKEKIFCENCWKEREKDYRNYPCDTEEVKRVITKNEMSEKTSTGFTSHGDWICYDPTKKEWVKEKLTSTNPKNEPVEKANDKWIIWIFLVVIIIILLLFVGYLWHKRKRKSRKRQKIN